MAYPTVSGPYGLKPINLIGGRVFAGSVRHFKIASGYNTSIFNGDLVKIINDGTIEKDAGTTTATPMGIFLGVSYTDSVSGFINRQYYPANTTADDLSAYVLDDPEALFQVAVVSGTTTIASVARTVIGNNMSLVQNAGDANTGDSRVAVLSTSAATTDTLPVRVVDVVPETATGTDAYPEIIIKWNFGMHQYNNATGVQEV